MKIQWFSPFYCFRRIGLLLPEKTCSLCPSFFTKFKTWNNMPLCFNGSFPHSIDLVKMNFYCILFLWSALRKKTLLLGILCSAIALFMAVCGAFPLDLYIPLFQQFYQITSGPFLSIHSVRSLLKWISFPLRHVSNRVLWQQSNIPSWYIFHNKWTSCPVASSRIVLLSGAINAYISELPSLPAEIGPRKMPFPKILFLPKEKKIFICFKMKEKFPGFLWSISLILGCQNSRDTEQFKRDEMQCFRVIFGYIYYKVRSSNVLIRCSHCTTVSYTVK